MIVSIGGEKLRRLRQSRALEWPASRVAKARSNSFFGCNDQAN